MGKTQEIIINRVGVCQKTNDSREACSDNTCPTNVVGLPVVIVPKTRCAREERLYCALPFLQLTPQSVCREVNTTPKHSESCSNPWLPPMAVTSKSFRLFVPCEKPRSSNSEWLHMLKVAPRDHLYILSCLWTRLLQLDQCDAEACPTLDCYLVRMDAAKLELGIRQKD